MIKDPGVQTLVTKDCFVSYSDLDCRYRHSWENSKRKPTLLKREEEAFDPPYLEFLQGYGRKRTNVGVPVKTGYFSRLSIAMESPNTLYMSPGPTRLMTTHCPLATHLVRRY